MLVQFKNSEPVDCFPDTHRLTPARARALARIMAEPKRCERMPMHPLPAAHTQVLAMAGMDAGIMAMRTGINVEAITAFFGARVRS